MSDNKPEPSGVQTSLTVAMPKDTNPNGDIFGGWLLSQMDIAGGVAAGRRAKGRTATVSVQEMVFHQPVNVGDLLACYAEVIRVGRTSLSVKIEAWASRHDSADEQIKVTEGVFTYVAMDDNHKPRPVPPE
ncbi:MAG: acyl-CoA thioesterase [Proteobacteria bacterium]|nr:acyl-CoA thioesterase [Pseudomonadota bacterium]